MRYIIPALALLGLTACAPQIPDSGARGVGFDTQAQLQRDAALSTGSALPPPTAISDETLPPATGTSGAASLQTSQTTTGIPDASSDSASDIAAETAAALAAASANSGVPPVQASPSNPPPSFDNPAISDENDFQAVSSRQSIESDAARIAANREQYEVIEPTAVPTRPGSAQPNIVSYALATSHPRGTRLYSRTGINMQQRAERVCAGYPSPDQAQIDFLDRGGPERDRLGVDPDGDGYACSWDPAPFRQAVQN